MFVPSVVTLLFLSTWSTADASKETLSACVTAQEVLYENNELDDAFTKMLEGYNATCHEEGLCTYSMDRETLDGFKTLSKTSSASELPELQGSGAAHFGGAFYDHVSFGNYITACKDAGGDVICVDAHLNLEGEAGAAFTEGSDGIKTDIKLSFTAYPVCMTKECEKEDLTTILENSAKTGFMKAPKIQEGMDAHTEALVKAATVRQVCALSGLATCELTVEKQTCGAKVAKAVSSSGPPASKAGGIVTFLAITASALYSML